MQMKPTRLSPLVALSALAVSCGPAAGKPAALPVREGQAQVAAIAPHDDGLQFCANLQPRDLAPAGATRVYVHSISVFISTTQRYRPALLAITGRYPGWNTPDTTVYNQPFTNTNTVWLEIVHEFPMGMMCIEVYGRGLRPSTYKEFKGKILVAYSYRPRRGPGTRTQKLIPFHWGLYLKRYAPHTQPKQ